MRPKWQQHSGHDGRLDEWYKYIKCEFAIRPLCFVFFCYVINEYYLRMLSYHNALYIINVKCVSRQ